MNPIQTLTKGIAIGAVLALATLATAPSATAQNFSDRTVFTETSPFEVGTTRLEPGTYLIRVVMLSSDRNLVQVTDEQQSKVYASVLATPHPIRGDMTVPVSSFLYYPPIAGHAKALRTWFSKSSAIGHDIAYPKDRAFELAVAIKEPVPAIEADVTEAEYETAKIEIVEPQTTLPVRSPAPPAPVQVADSGADDSLPQGASSVPLYALIGLLAIGAAIGIRMLRQA
jgi:hypothetical protein